jgi:hypothetical protein
MASSFYREEIVEPAGPECGEYSLKHKPSADGRLFAGKGSRLAKDPYNPLDNIRKRSVPWILEFVAYCTVSHAGWEWPLQGDPNIVITLSNT